MKILVIVESPAKAKTINKYLGNDYIVKSSIGHIRDLAAIPEELIAGKADKASKPIFKRMGINPENDWMAYYDILSGKDKVVRELKALASRCDMIYLASDHDREGEAIAWHVQQVLGGPITKYRRVTFNEITKKAIQEAFERPGNIDHNQVNAQQARRFLDRIVGFMVSPILWEKIARGLSAGRVQSIAVKLIVEREREIRAFIPEEYWEVHTNNKTNVGKIRLQALKREGQALRLPNADVTDELVRYLNKATYTVTAKDEKPTQTRPSPPFITSSLQQAASSKLGFAVKKTMMLAQRLYEAGYITYMRTDSTFLSQDAIQSVRGYIDKRFGPKYLPASPNRYSNKAGAQEAHEAIRPTFVTNMPEHLNGVDRDAVRLYDLIWKQFVSCQMTPAEYLATTITVEAGNVELKAKGRTLLFDGFTKVREPNKSEDDIILPKVEIGEKLPLLNVEAAQHFTKPPARYSEAALVKELEKREIGRPSTYAAIISTIQERGYVKLDQRRFYAEKIGEIVTDRLCESFPDLMSYSFTASLEADLDKVAHGNLDWKAMLNLFYGDLKHKLEIARREDNGMRRNSIVPVDITCTKCLRHMNIRTGATGVFLGCLGYTDPDPKARCKNTMSLTPVSRNRNGDTSEIVELMDKKRCQLCSATMDGYIIDRTRMLHICGNSPDCPGYLIEEGTFYKDEPQVVSIPCEKCTGSLVLTTGRFGMYYACECGNSRKALANGEPAPPRMTPIPIPGSEVVDGKKEYHFVVREGSSGLFVAASNFPKVRIARAPTVAELATVVHLLPDKFKYLSIAPKVDPQGLTTVIRFSRKDQDYYVSSIGPDNKPTKFTLTWKDGKWIA